MTVSLLPSGWNPKIEGDHVLADLQNICMPQVKGAHDSDLIILAGKAYIVYMANDVQPGEAPDWPFVYNALTVLDVKSRQIEQTLPFAGSNFRYENDVLPPGACFVPRIIQRDDHTLRCFFASEDPGKRQSQTWAIDFDLQSNSFIWKIQRVGIKTDQGNFPMQPQHFFYHAAQKGFTGKPVMHGLYLIDSLKRFDDRIVAVVNNFAGGQNALATLNTNMDQFTLLGDFFLPHEAKLTEAAVNRLPDGTWLAISRQENRDQNYMFSTSPDGFTWSPHAYRPQVQNGVNSKPIFERFGDLYYLGWNEATRVGGVHRSVFNLDISRDGVNWERKYRFETEKSFQYPTFRQFAGAIYLTVTQGDHSDSRKERIMFGKLESIA